MSMTALEDVPLTARSVVASTLLGTDPPRLPVSFLVRTGQIFGFSEPAVRTALSRMVANEEAIRNDTSSYELAGHLVSRQERQREGRSASTIEWDGTWTMFVVGQGSRSSSDRARLRVSMQRLRVGELREGVWTRPSNLAPDRLAEDMVIIESQCDVFTVMSSDTGLAERLWDLD
ncbi:MAG: hypothetical protein KDB26_15015, partial [Microthrixaceae bacterium]|nr:hypothetical protein [Microthrixaceae bacterium]